MSDPATLLRAMIEGSAAYDHKAAHDAAIRLVGGSERSLAFRPELVELAFQLPALALAVDLRQPRAVVEMFRENARVAVNAVLRLA